MIYKKFTQDWTSPDDRYHYKKGDEELIVSEDENSYMIGADIGIVYKVPKEYLEDKYYDQLEQDDKLNEEFRKFHRELVDRIAEWCKEHKYKIDEFSLGADEFEESCEFGYWCPTSDSYFVVYNRRNVKELKSSRPLMCSM
jgi:hypothetical protein